MTSSTFRKYATLCVVALFIGACRPAAPPSPPPDRGAVNTASSAGATPDAPLDQPAENVPPATATVAAGDAASGPDADVAARFDGYGDQRFGATVAAFRAAWNGPLKGGQPNDGDPQGCYVLSPDQGDVPAQRFFMFEGGRFVRFGTRSDALQAPGGGMVGMTTERIEALYDGRVQSMPHKYVEGGRYLSVAAPDGGSGKLVFETDASGQVSEWRVGVPPQIDYVEGCS